MVVDHPIDAALGTNDEDMAIDAVLAGHCIGQLAGTSAAAHLCAGRLMPLLTQHLAEKANFVMYYGSRAAQPQRVRAFIAFAIERLADGARLLLSPREPAAAARRRHAVVTRVEARSASGEGGPLDDLLGHSITYRIAVGRRAGQKFSIVCCPTSPKELDAPWHRIPGSTLATNDEQAIAEAWLCYALALDLPPRQPDSHDPHSGNRCSKAGLELHSVGDGHPGRRLTVSTYLATLVQ